MTIIFLRYKRYFLHTRLWLSALLCVVCLVVTGMALWSDAAATRQPQQGYLQEVFVQHFDPAATHARFDGVEELFSRLIPSTHDSAALSGVDAVPLLEAIARPLAAPDVSAASVERTRLLTEKSLPGTSGRWLAAMLEGYVCYVRQRAALQQSMALEKFPVKLVEERAHETPSQHSPQLTGELSLAHSLEAQHQHYRQEVAAREACLGTEVSRTLFAEQDRMAQLLLQQGADGSPGAAASPVSAVAEGQRDFGDGR